MPSERFGQPWSFEEDEIIYNDFTSSISVDDIAEKLSRSTGAILSRLHKLKLVDRFNQKIAAPPPFINLHEAKKVSKLSSQMKMTIGDWMFEILSNKELDYILMEKLSRVLNNLSKSHDNGN